jgi:peptidoglycan/LPS O-acetylase OafA/YrhL
VGVDLFFVMSGFLIGGIVIANKDAANFYSVFYVRRMLRIFPLYYLLLSVVAICVWASWIPRPQHGGLILYAIYLQNIVTALTHDYGLVWLQPTWSLAVEEHFYFLLPILVALTSPRYLKYILIGGIIIATSMRVLGYLIPVEYPRDFARFFTLCRIDDLFYGVLLANIIRDERIAAAMQRAIVCFYIAAGVLCATFLFVSHIDYHFPGEILLSSVGLSLLGPLFVCVVVLAIIHDRGWVARFTKAKMLRWIGTRTYAIYLFHMPAFQSVGAFLRHIKLERDGLSQLLALVLTLTCATASWHLIEAPLINLGHKRKYGAGAKPTVFQPTLENGVRGGRRRSGF